MYKKNSNKKIFLLKYFAYICIINSQLNNSIMKRLVILLVISCIVAILFSSCGTSGYGCKGRDSWNKTVRRINSPY